MAKGRATHLLVVMASPPITNGDTTGSASQNPALTATGGAVASTANPTVAATQPVTANVNPSFAVGQTANATSNGTMATGQGQATGAPQNVSPNQVPTWNQVTAPANQMASILQALAAYIGQMGQNALNAIVPTTTQPAGK